MVKLYKRLKKVAFIINTTTKRAHLVTKELVSSVLPEDEFECNFFYSEHRHHIIDIAEKIISENSHDIIASVGGCGTLYEVVQTAAYKPIQIAIIPTGAGNAMAYHLNIPQNIEKAIQRIRDGKLMRVDLGCITSIKTNEKKFFICYFAIGFSSLLAQKTINIYQRNFFEYFNPIRLIQIWREYKKPSLVLTFNFETKKIRPFEMFIGNINAYGRQVNVSSSCSIKDSTLEINIVSKVKPFRFFVFTIKSILNIPDDVFDINELHLSESIYIQFEKPTLTQIDFEPVLYDEQVKITVLPTAINLIA